MLANKDTLVYRKSRWIVPDMEVLLWRERKNPFCIIIPVINEGDRINTLLQRMVDLRIHTFGDIIIVDGGSNDGSLSIKRLDHQNVKGLLVKKGKGGLSAQLRCAYSFALDKGYEGLITIDGNNKDDPSAIIDFANSLDCGVDFIQGSRFLKQGRGVNTPKLREISIRCIHAPLLSLASGFKWTDTTQGFRAYSRRVLLDHRVNPFREVFINYELLPYLSYRLPRLGYICKELPTIRQYPQDRIPTKINGVRGYIDILIALIKACMGKLNP